jgi:hypothetical protein
MIYPQDEFTEDMPLDEREPQFYRWVGICIKEWAKIENSLFEICNFLLKTHRRYVAVVYYRTPTIDARLTLTEELVRMILPQRKRKDGGHDHPDVTTWRNIVTNLRDLLPVRNLMAHAPVSVQHHSEPFVTADGVEALMEKSTWLQIATSWHESLRGKPPNCIQDLELPYHFKKISAAGFDLEKFRLLLHRRYAKKEPLSEFVLHKSQLRSARTRASTRTRRAKSKPRPGSSRM